MKKKTKKLLIFIGIPVIIIVVILNTMSNGKKATRVHAEEVTVKELTEEVSASGYIQPKTKVNITSEVTAEIIAVPVKEGDQVYRGQLLVQLDTVQLRKDFDQYRYSLDEIQARSEAAKSLYLQAEEEFQRQKELFDRKLISETAFNNAEYSYQNNKFSYKAMLSQTKQARARYEKAEDQLSKTTMLAPMDGVITYLDAEVGEIAPAQTAFTQGKTLMTISNLSAFEVEVDVDETEIVKVNKGQGAKIEVDAFPDTTFQGEVIEIGNTAVILGAGSTEQTTNFKVKVLFKEENVDIRPGMSAAVDIVTNTKEEALAIPYGCIVMRTVDADSLARANADSTATDPDSSTASNTDTENEDTLKQGGGKKSKNTKELKGVFVVDEGKAKFVRVETGIADQKDIEVTSGLSTGDVVITGPYKVLRTIKNGEDVKTIEKPGNGRE
ncbi:MAG: efflux RND transporter periplasmic adaptor subunit [Candidatus Zixiibacteriota bacterium]|nr:MAG: efflux RND transporter periplasmic adaptor subunit [candidate division Zixibacteria bacterium]